MREIITWLIHDDRQDLFEYLFALVLNVLVSLPLALVGFLVFSVWPAGARVMYEWFFEPF